MKLIDHAALDRKAGGEQRRNLRFAVIAALLTPVVLLVHGYHPLADDGAIYVAGVKKLLNSSLFPSDSVFVLAPTRLSVFAHVLAAVVRWSHLSLPVVLLACQLTSIFLFLFGCYRVAGWGAALLGACLFTLPVAGTSLSLMDPYVTARSFSTPFTLFALAAVLEERWAWAALWIALTALVHPLMAAYALLALVALALAHLFLSSWQWFEYFGLLMPLLLLALSRRPLAIAATVSGAFALLVSICFVHRSGSLTLARVQPLRAFHFVYLAGLLLAGSLLARLPKRAVAGVVAALLLIVFAAQRFTYSSSNHIEWPGLAPRNDWQQAFLWIRDNTPQNAIFALDNDYIETPGEDAQGFRATAERSAVPDYFKDGGIASNFPQAANRWLLGSQATAHLNQATDAQRLERLAPLGATWIVLPAHSATALPCPYVNSGVRVCRLGPF